MSRKFYIRTFGCQMNEHDSERLAGFLVADGMEATERLEDADVVIFLHREHYYLSREHPPARSARETSEDYQRRLAEWSARLDETKTQASITVAKNRNGPTGSTRLAWRAPTTWFADETEPPDAPAWVEPF